MKRVKIAAVLLAVIAVYSFCSLILLKHYNNELKGRIEKIQQVYELGDTEGALILSDELNVYWHEYEKVVTMLIHDAALEEINSSIAKITPFISNENSELIAEIQSIYHRLDQIYEEEFPMWYNIL
ncbi:MAG: DUF4363 family protein [Ruminococcus sp.]|nr:DUF4363 family protein [Ruminococcus sp.]